MSKDLDNTCVQDDIQSAILKLATNFWLLVLSILHNHANRIIKQVSLSHWVAEYNLKVSSAW